MIIDSVEFRLLELPRRERFIISTGSSSMVRNWLVKLSVEGETGYGAAAPNNVTRETAEMIENSLVRLSDRLREREINGPAGLCALMDTSVRYAPAAKAALDIAFHDALARAKGVPLCEFLNGKCTPVLTDMTISILSQAEAVEHALRHAEQGFKALKLKVGTSIKDDISRVLAVREAVGDQLSLSVDANQGYSKREALEFIAAVKGADIEYLEQPVKASCWQPKWCNPMARLAQVSDIPIMADEMVENPKDAKRVLALGITHINIKLAKCGGLYQAQRIAELARVHGAKVMIGCMGESGVSIAAALHFAAANSDVVKWADLDSQFMLEKDVCLPLEFRDGMLWPKGPGSGVELTLPL